MSALRIPSDASATAHYGGPLDLNPSFIERDAIWQAGLAPDFPGIWVGEDGQVAAMFWRPGQCLWDPLGAYPGQCWTPPVDPWRYEAFHQGSAADPEQRVGIIGMGMPHAPVHFDIGSALAWYANPHMAVMRGRCYDDPEVGGWFVGQLFGDVTWGEVARLNAAALSGDWRVPPQYRSSGTYVCLGPLVVGRPGLPNTTAQYQPLSRAACAPVVGGVGGVPTTNGEPDMSGCNGNCTCARSAAERTAQLAAAMPSTGDMAGPTPTDLPTGGPDHADPNNALVERVDSIDERLAAVERLVAESMGKEAERMVEHHTS